MPQRTVPVSSRLGDVRYEIRGALSRRARELETDDDPQRFSERLQPMPLAMAQKLEVDLGDEVVIEQRARLEGRQMVMMIAPKKK